MADFEGLINQALAKQDSGNPAVREKVYQSSRNALVKMLEKTGNLSDDAVSQHFGRLEQSIARIEANYAAPKVDASDTEPRQNRTTIEEPEQHSSYHEAPEADEANLVQNARNEPVLQDPIFKSEASPAPVSDFVKPESVAESFTASAEPLPSASPAKEVPTTKSDAVSDVLAELEALLPPAYSPAPMFPAPAPRPVQPQAAPQIAMPQVARPQVARPEGTIPQAPVAMTPAPAQKPTSQFSPDGFQREPNFQAPQPPARQEVSSTRAVASPPLVQDNPPAVTSDFEAPYFDPPEKVSSYLGEVAAGAPEQDTYQNFDVEAEPLRTYKRRNPLLRRIWPIFLALAVVLVILWILYALFTTMNSKDTSSAQQIGLGPVGETQQADDGSVFITLLEPTDLSSLVTAGRGSAELVNEQNRQMLRLQSVRQGALAGGNAEPILLELEKGVLNQISGKEVTVELFAKSGLNGPAQFAVECDVAGDSICGRKRFLVGVQPERIVFALDLTAGIPTGARAFLAIHTDITNTADASGTGDAIDIIYVRLRLPDQAN